jgi:glutathione S-transferase
MLVLFQTPAAWGVPNVSPFCLKLEAYLRLAGIPYQVKLADPLKAPKGKVPYVELDGKLMGDSQLIIEHLQRVHGDPLDGKLTPQQAAIGHAVRRMLEESTYWNIVHERWAVDASWRIYRPIFKGMMPPLVSGLFLPLLRRGMLKQLHAQGRGRHSPEEIDAMGQADISAVATLLGDKPFLLGEEPSSFDATVYAFLMSILAFPEPMALQRHTRAQENLVRYCERFKARVFADWKPVETQAA